MIETHKLDSLIRFVKQPILLNLNTNTLTEKFS